MNRELEGDRARSVLHAMPARAATRARGNDGAGVGGVTVARTSGGVSWCGGGAGDWRPAWVGLPLAARDRLYTARGAGLELSSPAFEIRLAPATGLDAIDLTDDVKRFRLWGGAATFLVRRIRPGEIFEVETSDAAVVRIVSEGEYRIEADAKESTGHVVGRGAAAVPASDVAARGDRCGAASLGSSSPSSNDAFAVASGCRPLLTVPIRFVDGQEPTCTRRGRTGRRTVSGRINVRQQEKVEVPR